MDCKCAIRWADRRNNKLTHVEVIYKSWFRIIKALSLLKCVGRLASHLGFEYFGNVDFQTSVETFRCVLSNECDHMGSFYRGVYT